MSFPRLINYNFDINTTYTSKVEDSGRIDRVADKTFNYTQMYKPIMWMNNISLGVGMRAGIRPIEEEIANELSIKNKQVNVSNEDIQKISLELRPNQYWWNSYGDVSNGYLSDISTGDVLLMPTFESAERWMRNYQFINQSDESVVSNSDNLKK